MTDPHISGGRYDGPAGLVLSRDEVQLVMEALTRSAATGERQSTLLARITRYLSNEWELGAQARSRATD
jgi:hypothetical protein